MVNIFIFVYSVCILLLCFAAAILSLAAYLVSERKSFIPQVTFFIFYIIELGGIFGNEWLSQNLTFSADSYYEISTPIMRVITGTGILASLWLMLLRVLDVHDRRTAAIPPTIFAIASILVLNLMPYGPVRQFTFYTLRQVFVAFALGFAYVKWATSTDQAYRERLGKHKGRFAILCLLLCMIVAEDIWVILVAPVPDPNNSLLPLYLSERNFSENILMIYVAYHCISEALRLLKLRFMQPQAETSREDDLARHISDALPAYAKNHSLTTRESEVLALVLAGKDNRSIATELILSEGTIKTHVHNIMRKTETKNREELRRNFWAN